MSNQSLEYQLKVNQTSGGGSISLSGLNIPPLFDGMNEHDLIELRLQLKPTDCLYWSAELFAHHNGEAEAYATRDLEVGMSGNWEHFLASMPLSLADANHMIVTLPHRHQQMPYLSSLLAKKIADQCQIRLSLVDESLSVLMQSRSPAGEHSIEVNCIVPAHSRDEVSAQLPPSSHFDMSGLLTQL